MSFLILNWRKLKNGEFELRITGQWQDEVNLRLVVESQHSLDGVIASHVIHPENQGQPINLRPLGENGKQWSLTIINPNINQDRLRLAASANKAVYYGDAGLVFINYETAFNNDFREE